MSLSNYIQTTVASLASVLTRLQTVFTDRLKHILMRLRRAGDRTEDQRIRLFVERFAEDPILHEAFVEAMDEETRRIYSWQLHGLSILQIEKELDVTVDMVSKRYMGGLERAANKVHRRGLSA